MGVAPTPISHRIEDDDENTIIETMTGTVKWYKPDKGFGFVIPADGMKDVFIHKTCLEKHELHILIPGQKLKMRMRCVPKGREVIDFEFDEGDGTYATSKSEKDSTNNT